MKTYYTITGEHWNKEIEAQQFSPDTMTEPTPNEFGINTCNNWGEPGEWFESFANAKKSLVTEYENDVRNWKHHLARVRSIKKGEVTP
jgi:hypothetical protein